MPGPSNHKRRQVKPAKPPPASAAPAPPEPKPCKTLDEDEITQCSSPATHGYPVERCRVHHKQYITLTTKYKKAQQFVDQVRAGATIPTRHAIEKYTDLQPAKDKAAWIRRYLEAIREERTGREIHHRRFFLKSEFRALLIVCRPHLLTVDDGHKKRLKVLRKEMIAAVEAMDVLNAQILKLCLKDSPNYPTASHYEQARADNAEASTQESELTPESLADQFKTWQSDVKKSLGEDDDLIDIHNRQ
jgi:hypothetical protein